MKILITGAYGFVGQNLAAALEEICAGHDRRLDHVICERPEEMQLYRFGRKNTARDLDAYCADCDFVVHLAGVNRPKDTAEFMSGNHDLTVEVLDALRKHDNDCPVLLASSTQASLTGRFTGSEYGKSKLSAEEAVFCYGEHTGAPVFVYRFPNIFGKWCRPNYNSVVATFCYNTANGLPIQVNDPSVEMDLVYIDDVVDEIIQTLRGKAHREENGFCSVPTHHETTLGHVAETIRSFSGIRERLEVPQLDDALTKKLYSTYLSYLPADNFVYGLRMNQDARGSFTELIRTPDRGQFSVNISKPGVTKGNHWHHTKNEKFVVVKGEGLIRLRRIGTQPDGTLWPVTEVRVSGDTIQSVEMIPGYTHSIVNLSDTEDLVTFMWANEAFEPERPDTFFQEV